MVSKEKCKEETALRNLINRNPEFKKIIKSAKALIRQNN